MYVRIAGNLFEGEWKEGKPLTNKDGRGRDNDGGDGEADQTGSK